MGVFIPKGQIGVLRYDTGPSVGLLLTPQQIANGAITPQMHEAGCMFRSQFRSAMLDGMRVSSLVRVTDRPTRLHLNDVLARIEDILNPRR